MSSWRRKEPNFGIHVAFSFQLAENLSGKLQIAVGERFGGALQARPRALRIEEFDAARCACAFRQRVTKFARGEKRCQACFAIPLWTTRLMDWETAEFTSEAGGGI